MPKKLIPKERVIFDFIRFNQGVTNQEILEAVKSDLGEIHRNTLIGYLNSLVEKKLIQKVGAGGFDVRYIENIPHKGYKYFDVDKYFLKEADEREITPFFDEAVFGLLKDTFTDYELAKVKFLNENYRQTIASSKQSEFRRELERFTIELAWKSSRIEGNTYSLIDTEILIKKNQEARGHSATEAREIMNHKKAIDFILENKGLFKVIDVEKIIELHSVIVDGLDVSCGLRDGGVGITGSQYRPLGSQKDIKAALQKLVDLINALEEPIERAFVSVIMISYIQPFVDGNKRTSRMLGNAILLANDMAPLSYRSVDEADYKKGIILFYEQNSFRNFKEMFIEQFKFSINNYFSLVSGEPDNKVRKK